MDLELGSADTQNFFPTLPDLNLEVLGRSPSFLSPQLQTSKATVIAVMELNRRQLNSEQFLQIFIHNVKQ